jgi:hypothetical protein
MTQELHSGKKITSDRVTAMYIGLLIITRVLDAQYRCWDNDMINKGVDKCTLGAIGRIGVQYMSAVQLFVLRCRLNPFDGLHISNARMQT